MPKDIPYFNFNCGTRSRCDSSACVSHFITVPVLEKIIMQDIAEKAEKILGHEAEFKRKYLKRQASLANQNQSEIRKELKKAEKRAKEIDKFIKKRNR